MVGSLDRDDRRLGEPLRQEAQRGLGRVLVAVARDHQHRHVPLGERGEGPLTRHPDGRRDQDETGEPAPFGDAGRHDRSEGVAGQQETAPGADGRLEVIERRLGVALLGPALVVRAGGCAHAAEVEAAGGESKGEGHLGRADDHGVVHVAAVERMGVADGDAGCSAGRHRDLSLEAHPVGRLKGHFLLGYHMAQRIPMGRWSVQPTC